MFHRRSCTRRMDVRQGGGTAYRIPATLPLTGQWRIADRSAPPSHGAAVLPKLLIALLAVFAWGCAVGQGECNANPTSISEDGKGELGGGLSVAAVSAFGERDSGYYWRQLQWCFLAGQVWTPLRLSHAYRCFEFTPLLRSPTDASLSCRPFCRRRHHVRGSSCRMRPTAHECYRTR